MAVITINGQVGSASRDIGAMVAHQLNYDYVDRLILAEAAHRLGATVEALAQKEQHAPSLGERIGRFLNTLMERSALAGSGADPYFGPGLGILLGQDYPHAVEEPISHAEQLEDDQFIEATKSVITDLANEGNTVIIGRASNLILKDRDDAFHVGIVSTFEDRVKVLVAREQITDEEARRIATEHERARIAYFKRFFLATVDNPADYHIMLNTHYLTHETTTNVICDVFTSHLQGRYS